MVELGTSLNHDSVPAVFSDTRCMMTVDRHFMYR